MNRSGLKDKVKWNVTGQTLTFDCPQGRPSANGTVKLYDARYAFDDAGHNPINSAQVATRSSVTMTASGAAGPSQADPKNIPTTPHASLKVGDFLWLTAAATKRVQRVEVTEIKAAAITVADDLVFEYATSDTLESAIVTSPAIPDAFITDENNIVADCFADWLYTVGGVTYFERTYFDVVREAINWQPDDAWLLERQPDLMRYQFGRQKGTFVPQIRTAARDVELDITSLGLDPDRYRAREFMREVVGRRAEVRIAATGFHPNGIPWRDHFELVRDDYDRTFEQLTGHKLHLPYDRNHDDQLATGEKNESVIDLEK